MSTPSIYLNLEDDVSKIVQRIKRSSSKQLVLVCPKRCLLFADSINLRLLKKQIDLMDKEVFILTMDERGQLYAKEAGFALRFLPKSEGSKGLSDVKVSQKRIFKTAKLPEPEVGHISSGAGPISALAGTVKEIAKKLVPVQNEELVETAITEEELRQPRHHRPQTIPKVKITDALFPKETDEAITPEKRPKAFHGKVVTGLVALSLIVLLAVVFVVLPKATVAVYPRTEPVTRDMEISISPNIASLDPAKLVLPATKVDETVNLSVQFQSQGKKQVGNKATGTVKIYNFTRLPLNLKAATTVLNVGSKSYNLINDVMGLKPTTYSNAKTKEVDVNSLGDSIEVIASDGGEDFNLPAGTRMEITNQVFGSKPLLLYAKTDSEITGGTTRYLSVIDANDLAAAQNQLQSQALDQIRAKLKTSGLSLPEKSYAFQVTQFTTDNPLNSQTPNFQASLQAKLSGIAYKDSDLSSLIFQRITQTLDTDKTLKQKDQNSTAVKVKSYDPVAQLAVLSVHFEGEAVYDINFANIESELVGKSQAQANEILRSKAEIDRVDITLAPAWQKNFPWFANKIKVTVVKDPQSD